MMRRCHKRIPWPVVFLEGVQFLEPCISLTDELEDNFYRRMFFDLHPVLWWPLARCHGRHVLLQIFHVNNNFHTNNKEIVRLLHFPGASQSSTPSRLPGRTQDLKGDRKTPSFSWGINSVLPRHPIRRRPSMVSQVQSVMRSRSSFASLMQRRCLSGPAGQETTQQNHTITLCIADTGA